MSYTPDLTQPVSVAVQQRIDSIVKMLANGEATPEHLIEVRAVCEVALDLAVMTQDWDTKDFNRAWWIEAIDRYHAQQEGASSEPPPTTEG